MLTDKQLRDRLHQQIDRLVPDKLQLLERFLSALEENEPINAISEDTTEYISLEKADITDDVTVVPASKENWRAHRPFNGSQEEWFQYFQNIEEGVFHTLDEANQDFEQWKMQYIKSRL